VNEMWVKMPKSRNSYLKLMTGRVFRLLYIQEFENKRKFTMLHCCKSIPLTWWRTGFLTVLMFDRVTMNLIYGL